MAGDGEEETEYESDPEEVMMSLKMRRREASDDEDGGGEDEDEEREREVPHPRAGMIDSEGESDGQGGVAEYDEDDLEGEEEGGEYYDEQEYEEYEAREIEVENGGDAGGGEGEEMVGEVLGATKVVEETDVGHEEMGGQGQGEEKKENEPFAVPTSGAFYMHDDRFRDNAGGRHSCFAITRRTFDGRKLWETKDDRKWGHDKFEEMNMQERHYDEGRRPSRGYYRGRGRARGADRGYARGNRMRAYGGNKNQNVAPKDVRGRGPRRYQPSMKSKSETLPPQNKQMAKPHDKTSHGGSGRSAPTANPNAEYEPVIARKVASNLSSASPPFYPSGSSNREISSSQKKQVQDGNHNRNICPSIVDHSFSMPLSNSLSRGKNVTDSVGMDKLHIEDCVPPASAKTLNNVHLSSSASSSLGATQMARSRAHGRGVAPTGSAIFQTPQTNNQVNKVPPPAAQASQRNHVQTQGQPSLQASGHQLGQRPVTSPQGSSPPKAGLSLSTFEPENVVSPLESGKSKIALARKGKGAVQGTGRASFAYGGPQVMGPGGNTGAGHGDQNIPAFFPVMQFGGQHPGGIGVPAVGMAFPGYVAQPNGLGNSEMTWLPVLASAAGALGATYCPPYIAVDGTYHPQPTGQTSSLPAPSKDNNLSKPNNESKPQQRYEVTNDEFSHRQNKPRRYSEMNFSQ